MPKSRAQGANAAEGSTTPLASGARYGSVWTSCPTRRVSVSVQLKQLPRSARRTRSPAPHPAHTRTGGSVTAERVGAVEGAAAVGCGCALPGGSQSRMLSGLMSACTTPQACMCASAICTAMGHQAGRERAQPSPASRRWAQDVTQGALHAEQRELWPPQPQPQRPLSPTAGERSCAGRAAPGRAAPSTTAPHSPAAAGAGALHARAGRQVSRSGARVRQGQDRSVCGRA